MGMWIILIGDEQFNLSSIKAMDLGNRLSITENEEKQLDILYNDGYVSFQYDYNGCIMRDFSLQKLSVLPYQNPHFILMKYSNSALMKSIISSVEFPENIYIDCDGVNLGLDQIIDRSRLLSID